MTDIPGRMVLTTAAPAIDGWKGAWWSGPAAALHALDWPHPLAPTIWTLEVDAPALVLGSTQPLDGVDRRVLADADVELARRRSGGGAVFLEPDGSVWIDLFIPRRDPRWHDDVGRSFRWLGEAWAGALIDLGLDQVEVHAGALVCGRYGRQVCFAGIGPGEVTVEGAKAVGLSQRRTREGARFQCVVHRAWSPKVLAALDGVDPEELPPVAVVAEPAVAIEAALLAHLA